METHRKCNAHDAIEVLTEKLADRRRHVVLLLGAGTGCAGGVPDLAGSTDQVVKALSDGDAADFGALVKESTLEESLGSARAAKRKGWCRRGPRRDCAGSPVLLRSA